MNLPITLNPRAVSLAEGLRAGIAVAVTLLVGDILNLPHFGLAALGALLTCFADPGGPVQRRVPAVVVFALCSGVVYGLFGWLRGEGVWLAVAVAAPVMFCASFARVYGQGGLQVGNLLSVVVILAVGMPAGSAGAAAGQGLNFCAGAAWAAVLTLAIWRVHPYQPSRLALAEVAGGLGALAADLAELAGAEVGAVAFEAHAAQHRRGVREAIEAARQVALEIFRGRGLVSPRGAQLTLRLQTFEQIFAGLIALSDTLEAWPAYRGLCAEPLRIIAARLHAAGPEIVAQQSLDTPETAALLARLRDAIAKLPVESEPNHLLGAIAENLAVLATVSAPAADIAGPAAPRTLRALVLAPARQNFNLAAAPLRHALRTVMVAVPALAATLLYGGPFAHWATITMILCLQPYFSATWLRSAERIAGTAFGGALAAGIGLLSQTRLELALAMLPLTAFAFTIRSVSYGLFVAALTPMIVLLIEQIAPGADELQVALARVGYTLLGGGLAVAANLLLWPAFEGGRLEAGISAAMAAHAAFARAVFEALAKGGPAPDAARRAAGMASNNLEAALSRALLEPHGQHDRVIERGAVVDAALRRMAGRLSVLALDRPVIPPGEVALWQDWADWLAARLAGAKPPRPALPEGPGAETLIRLARQAELMAG